MGFRAQLEELLDANGWKSRISVTETSPGTLRLMLLEPHPAEPEGWVGDYTEGVHSLEQVQHECLRALRTGRTGL